MINKETKEKIAHNSASVWSRCFKCDGVVNEAGAKCKKPSATCLKWYDAYKGALIALDHIEQTTGCRCPKKSDD